MQTTTERLQGFYPFSDATLATVEAIAGRHQNQTLGQFFDGLGIGEGTQPFQIRDYKADGRIQVADFGPEDGDTFVYHLPMANPLDSNQMFQIGTVASAMPDARLIAVGNPSGRRASKAGTLRGNQRTQVRDGNLRSVVTPINHYVEDCGIEEANQIGYSYGVEKALKMASTVNAKVSEVVAIEPVSLRRMSVPRLGRTFMSTDKGLQKHKADAESPVYKEARRDAIKLARYTLGLVTPTNLAISKYMARGEFSKHAHEALTDQPDARLHLVWGTETEFRTGETMPWAALDLAEQHNPFNIKTMPLKDGKHALANDVYLQAAIVLESVTRA